MSHKYGVIVVARYRPLREQQKSGSVRNVPSPTQSATTATSNAPGEVSVKSSTFRIRVYASMRVIIISTLCEYMIYDI